MANLLIVGQKAKDKCTAANFALANLTWDDDSIDESQNDLLDAITAVYQLERFDVLITSVQPTALSSILDSLPNLTALIYLDASNAECGTVVGLTKVECTNSTIDDDQFRGFVRQLLIDSNRINA